MMKKRNCLQKCGMMWLLSSGCRQWQLMRNSVDFKGWGVTISDAETDTAEAMREKMMPQQEKVIAKYKLDGDLVTLAAAAAK